MEKEREKALSRKIEGRILSEGPITFREFMRMALYEPGLGYYMRPDTEIGKAGDFYTSPHLHPAFGQMIAKQIEEMWALLGKGPFTVIEQGPGKGYLAKDILDYIEAKNGELYGLLSYHLIELNPALKEFQGRLLGEKHQNRISWGPGLAEKAAEKGKGVLLANELLDAFPVHLVRVRGGALMEIRVGYAPEKGFYEVLAAPSAPEIEEYIKEFAPDGVLPEGYRTEVDLDVRGWLKEVKAAFKGGFFLLVIDYGYPAWDYYGPERDRGTLMCYRGHRTSENPYKDPGSLDITAHVNFSALERWGRDFGFRCAGFCPQGTYLVSLGLEEILGAMSQADILKVKGLLLPGTMGQTHKVMVLYNGPKELPALRGFSMRNQCKAL